MRTSKIVSVSMTPEMFRDARHLAREESRTVSELFREALRRYQQEQRWARIRAMGSERARDLGIKEEDVVGLIHEFRREQRKRKRRSAPRRNSV
jgi:CopG family transcriptional regulator/antitoxin EndoAI